MWKIRVTFFTLEAGVYSWVEDVGHEFMKL